MKIAVLSGKGGTGKTTVSASLALSLGRCQYIDCDVEEPNGALFLKPDIEEEILVKVPVPEVNQEKCVGCGACSYTCQFNALAVAGGKVLVFPQLCHGCGACSLICPQKAITEKQRQIGKIEVGNGGNFIHGILNIGEPSGVPIIRQLKQMMKSDIPVIIDCPPGASCSVVEAIDGVDFCLLVTEATPFGLHDLKIAVELVRKMKLAFGVVINKADNDLREIYHFCEEEGIDVLLEIPFSPEIAKNYSQGILPVEYDEKLKKKFVSVYRKLEGGKKS